MTEALWAHPEPMPCTEYLSHLPNLLPNRLNSPSVTFSPLPDDLQMPTAADAAAVTEELQAQPLLFAYTLHSTTLPPFLNVSLADAYRR